MYGWTNQRGNQMIDDHPLKDQMKNVNLMKFSWPAVMRECQLGTYCGIGYSESFASTQLKPLAVFWPNPYL